MTRTLSALAATLLLSLAPSVATAKPKATFTIRGAGFGHGVGMSQYGALGYAQHGAGAAEILAHYYSGTALGTTDPNRRVRVQLVPAARAARISGARAAGARTLDPTVTYTVKRHGLSQVDLLARGRRVATFNAPLEVAGDGGVTALGGRGYRGVLEFAPSLFNGISVINSVGLDDYLQGVVPAESPSSWPAAALQAQAIAARTYAITTSRGGSFDQFPDTRSQVYGGVAVETPASNQAVAATRGQIVTYQGQPVVTYFFSTSGGRTESVENTTLGREPRPWLQSVDDPYDGVSPRHRWTPQTMSLARAGKKLRGLVKGSFRGIRVLERGS
jgi:peptidoglycan hydrolase-like amidase